MDWAAWVRTARAVSLGWREGGGGYRCEVWEGGDEGGGSRKDVEFELLGCCCWWWWKTW